MLGSAHRTQKIWAIILFIVNFPIVGRAYNFKVKNAKVFEAPRTLGRGSYFGFATALWEGSKGDSSDASILVGAPRANTSATPTVLEPGAVYKCRISGDCIEWNLDPTTNGYQDNGFKVNQIKDNAWIGATIGVADEEQPRVVVCAPRWKNNIINGNLPNWFMNGICYWSVVRDEATFQAPAENRIVPLLGVRNQISSGALRFYNYGMGQSGFSLHLTSEYNASRVVFGNPGVYNWKGVPSMITFRPNHVYDQLIPQIGPERLVHSGDYFGYSVTSGFYFAPGDRWYASGAPRGATMRGQVLIFRFVSYGDKRLVVSKVLEGEQHGEYFGASLASCDINNDGISEIIVGAPLWSKQLEEGRVYAYVIKGNGEFKPNYLEGEAMRGRFGTTVTCLGDLDHDGYGDIAVGAPYENNHGAIYIYNGNAEGLSKTYSQRINGESISASIRGFGASISEPRDIDGNAYSDLAIGAYQSGHVVLLRSQPVVTMRITVTNENHQELHDDSTFFVVNVCAVYNGFRVPQKLDVERIVKVDPAHGRAFFGANRNPNDTYTLPDTLHRGKHACDQLRINIMNGIQNIIDPIEVIVTLILANSSDSYPESVSLPVPNEGLRKTRSYCPDCPVVNKMLSKLEDSTVLSFAVDCGPDNVCSSMLDLSMTADLESGNRYTLGSKPTVGLMVGVANRGEPAYKAQAHIYIPAPISLGSMPRECTENPRLDGILEITCELGNPLRDQKIFVLELDMSRVFAHSKEISVAANVTTQSVNLNAEASNRNFTIYFDVDVDIAIAGKSQDLLYSYFDQEENKKLEVVKFQHIYEVQKFGQSPIEESSLVVLVPTTWTDGGQEVEVARINQIMGIMDGRRLYCSGTTNDDQLPAMDLPQIENLKRAPSPHQTSNKNRTFERFSLPESTSLNVPPENRTIYLNCTNPNVNCTTVSCNLGTFANSLTVAKLVITLDLQLKNFPQSTMEARDIVFFVSNGTAIIKQPGGIVQSFGDKPDTVLVGTTFVGAPVAREIATWIIVLSVILGILLLVLLTFGLIKLGFFHRKKREELEALKAESDNNHGFVLETSSSREDLDKP